MKYEFAANKPIPVFIEINKRKKAIPGEGYLSYKSEANEN